MYIYTFVHMYVLGKLNSALMSHVRLQTSYNLENSDVAYLDITRKSDCLDAQAGLCLLSHTTKTRFLTIWPIRWIYFECYTLLMDSESFVYSTVAKHPTPLPCTGGSECIRFLCYRTFNQSH